MGVGADVVVVLRLPPWLFVCEADPGLAEQVLPAVVAVGVLVVLEELE